MKPGARDRLFKVLITGSELEELQTLTGWMAESFGLDDRIERYKGKRPIGLYRWDLECLVEIIGMALKDEDEYPDRTSPGYQALKSLLERLKPIYEEAFQETDSETEQP